MGGWLLAIEFRHVEIIPLLLEAGCDINGKDNYEDADGWTGFQMACNNGNVEVIPLLLEAGCDIDHHPVVAEVLGANQERKLAVEEVMGALQFPAAIIEELCEFLYRS